MTDTNTPAAETPSISEQASAGIIPEGHRIRRTFVPKDLMPNKSWINQNIITNKGNEQTVGALVTIGRLYGTVTGSEKKQNTLPDGKVVESIVLVGAFASESYITGEIAEGMTRAFPPMMYAELIQSAMIADKTLLSVEIDCDIGLQYTGKSIPYEWVIIAFREGKEMDALKRIKNGRGRPATAGQIQLLSAPANGVYSGATVSPPAPTPALESAPADLAPADLAPGEEPSAATQGDGDVIEGAASEVTEKTGDKNKGHKNNR
jgi:hypothetical protein